MDESNKKSASVLKKFHLGGRIDENTDFSHLVVLKGLEDDQMTNWECHFDLADIKFINSIGVKKWVRFFSQLTQKGVIVMFERCSEPVVEQLNAISNFSCGARVESVSLPYFCKDCRNEYVGYANVSDMKYMLLSKIAPPMACPQCKSTHTVFDEFIDEYLEFLEYIG